MTPPDDDDLWDERAWGMAEGQRDPSASLPRGYLEAKLKWLQERHRKLNEEVQRTFSSDDTF